MRNEPERIVARYTPRYKALKWLDESGPGLMIKKYRKNRRIKQEDLARMLGRTPSWLSHIESGRHGVSAYVFFQIVGILGIPLGTENIKELTPKENLLLQQYRNAEPQWQRWLITTSQLLPKALSKENGDD